ncbi:MAG: (Fe-S)-binding protein [Solirubrobacterales bacterium]
MSPEAPIALFVTCLNDTLFPRVGQATVRLLERLGHQVSFPAEQTCCGQMHVNSGYGAEALPMLRRFLAAFGDQELIVSPSASCVATVRSDYPAIAREAGDPGLAAHLEALTPRVFELCELLTTRLKLTDVSASFPHRVAYHPTCHSLRGLELGDAPLRLLGAVRGLELVELPEAEVCCGFGGTFAVKNADTSAAMLADKLAALRACGAEVCTTVDSSCLMHIGGGLSRTGGSIRTLHIAEILASEAGPAS